MDLPIESMLSGKRLEIARMQDLLVGLIYDYVQPDAILYGGTAIWRCFGGGRFSEDIDIYVGKGFQAGLNRVLSQNGLGVTWKDEELPLHMRISDGRTDVLLEAGVGRYENRISQYTKTDGTPIIVSVLAAPELCVRKMEAYSGRRYVRDIYDLVHLTNYVDKDDHYIRQRLKQFLKDVKEPVDEGVLRALVYKGPVMTFNKMVEYLGRWSE